MLLLALPTITRRVVCFAMIRRMWKRLKMPLAQATAVGVFGFALHQLYCAVFLSARDERRWIIPVRLRPERGHNAYFT